MTQQNRLAIVLGLNLSLIAALVILGLTAHSVGVIVAAGDTAADSVALVLGLIAVSIRDRSSHLWRSLAIPVVALINGGALVVVAVLIVVEAVRRLVRGVPEVHGLPVLIVSAVTMAVLLVGAWVLGASAANEDLHMRSVLLDTLADAAAAGAVAIAGAVIAHRTLLLARPRSRACDCSCRRGSHRHAVPQGCRRDTRGGSRFQRRLGGAPEGRGRTGNRRNQACGGRDSTTHRRCFTPAVRGDHELEQMPRLHAG